MKRSTFSTPLNLSQLFSTFFNMKQNNIDAYLEGKLSGSALESFEAAMSNDPSLGQTGQLPEPTDRRY